MKTQEKTIDCPGCSFQEIHSPDEAPDTFWCCYNPKNKIRLEEPNFLSLKCDKKN